MKTILVVGSTSDNSGEISEIVTGPEHMVIAVEDENAALSVFHEGMPLDIIILACRADGQERLDLLRSVKRSTPSVPVIMVTECGSIEAYLKALSLGVFEYLIKPVALKELRRVVDKALTKDIPAGCYQHIHASGIVVEHTA